MEPVCPVCAAFYRRERDEECPLHPQASRFWRDRRPAKLKPHELIHLGRGGVLMRQSDRYPYIMMWL